MQAPLIQTARNNRLAALAYLQEKKARSLTSGEVVCLKTMREKLQPKPVFLTRRADSIDLRIAA